MVLGVTSQTLRESSWPGLSSKGTLSYLQCKLSLFIRGKKNSSENEAGGFKIGSSFKMIKSLGMPKMKGILAQINSQTSPSYLQWMQHFAHKPARASSIARISRKYETKGQLIAS